MQLIGLLLAAALVVKLWPWIVGSTAVIVVVVWARRVADRHSERVGSKRRRLAELAARADQQHEWVMAGDDRGIYGPEGAKLMHVIEASPQAVAPTAESPVVRWHMGSFGTRFAS